MKQKKKILISVAVLVFIIAIIVAVVMIRQDNGWRNLTYEQYNELSAAEQEEYFYSFNTVEDFFAWYNKVKEEYEKNQEYTEIDGDGNISIGEEEDGE